MSPDAQEAAVLDSIVPQLEADGFDVYTRPAAHLLPPFMQSYSPDAIALRDDRKLAIEVMREGPTSKGRLDKVRALLTGHQDWELRVYWVSPSNNPPPIETASRPTIEEAIRVVEELTAEGRHGPALLMAWATFEALGRALLPGKCVRPQTPAGLVETMAGAGHITPDEADELRRLAMSRSQLAHGALQVRVVKDDLDLFTNVLKTLFGFAFS